MSEEVEIELPEEENPIDKIIARREKRQATWTKIRGASEWLLLLAIAPVSIIGYFKCWQIVWDYFF